MYQNNLPYENNDDGSIYIDAYYTTLFGGILQIDATHSASEGNQEKVGDGNSNCLLDYRWVKNGSTLFFSDQRQFEPSSPSLDSESWVNVNSDIEPQTDVELFVMCELMVGSPTVFDWRSANFYGGMGIYFPEPFECEVNAVCDPQVGKPIHKITASVLCTTGQTITNVAWKLFDENYNLIVQGTGNPVYFPSLNDQLGEINYILEALVTTADGKSGYFYGDCMYSEGA